MSLYYDAATLLSRSNEHATSLKSRVYSTKGLKSTPSQLYALATEATKWSHILKEVVENSQLLNHERKLSPPLGLLLVHDLLLAKKGIATPASHPLRLAVERHKARLQAEFTKARLRRGFPSIDALRANVDKGQEEGKGIAETQGGSSQGSTVNGLKEWSHPRWVRINTLRTSLQEQLETTFAAHRSGATLDEILRATPSNSPPRLLHMDIHIPDLIALPNSTDLSTLSAYKQGHLILQDKASCFPAYLLNPQPEDEDIIDACAAPGNKTTHLAAIAHIVSPSKTHKIWACERDKARAATLQKMVSIAGADQLVNIKAGQDFLRLKPEEQPWCNVGALLLDPSCSGSGIIGRDDSNARMVFLPSRDSLNSQPTSSRKRKRSKPTPQLEPEEIQEEAPANNIDAKEGLQHRLQALSTFQTLLLTHAFRFPRARKITYSTCSIHAEENEAVVLKALASPIAKQRGWEVLKRDRQVEGMKAWPVRGDLHARDGDAEVAEACIRCEKGTEQGTMGFFVVGFVRDLNVDGDADAVEGFGKEGEKDQGEDEWSGCGDSDSDTQ
ncbi:hypothetical protein MMC30_004323 [Trapelia coarctata]|nr:hypothetical protein [Trapelia coarctata]